ncbi:hypothetical protein [[Clostridium] aminophilum]|uniref:Uncharacterized protein n=1 Tax=[Clostridium] aminophilum TaxID=1526 RepID=A0A1I6JJ12_9FIRM|nr:hypothetical protein [[Clostridium] aminophilum]SFR78925.1 hypothetical protein SAMN02910262_01557 [[Clostridium] aminophilum]
MNGHKGKNEEKSHEYVWWIVEIIVISLWFFSKYAENNYLNDLKVMGNFAIFLLMAIGTHSPIQGVFKWLNNHVEYKKLPWILGGVFGLGFFITTNFEDASIFMPLLAVPIGRIGDWINEKQRNDSKDFYVKSVLSAIFIIASLLFGNQWVKDKSLIWGVKEIITGIVIYIAWFFYKKMIRSGKLQRFLFGT